MHRAILCLVVVFALVCLAIPGCSDAPDATAVPAQTPGPAVAESAEATESRSERQPYTVRVVDATGRGVSGAWVGVHGGFWKKRSPDWIFASILDRAKPEWRGQKSGDDGTCVLFAEDFFRQSGVLVALHVAKRLVGIKKVSRDELAKVAKEKAALEIILQSACRVQGQIDSTGLRERKLPLWCNADVDYDGRPCFSFVSEKQEFEFFLPPGTFEIEADAGYCHRTTQRITIDPEQRELKMMFDLPLTRMAKLIGQPAPELRDVVAWKNSKPLTLADLRGKYVLLDFWGYWCGPCVHQMPELFVRHDRFAKYGLVVIGVHVDAAEGSVDTVAKLDAKLDGIRQSVWQGRDLPFPVALVSPKKTKYEGTEKFARCAASADFGVTGYPTCVLIDREGRVVDTIGFGQKEDERLAKLLGVGKRELPSTLHVR